MKAFVVTRYKSTAGMGLAEVADPVAGPEDVLVRVHAAGVNPVDTRIQRGELKIFLPYEVPFVLGSDVAGEVVQVGPRVTRFRVGDEVFAHPAKDRMGCFAELVAIDQADLALKPRSLNMEQAAGLPLVALTAWQALVERADLQPGQKVLVHAGSGGVGSIAIQLAKHLGATVATTVGTANVDWARSLGADVVIDYKTQDFEQVVDHYDVVLVSQDAETLTKSLRVLKPGGIAVCISGPPDPGFAAEMGANALITMITRVLSAKVRRQARKLGVRYTFLFMHADGTQLATLADLVDAGTVQTITDSVYELDATRAALERVDTGRAKGKVVIRVQ